VRGLIGVAGFALVFAFARPSRSSLLASLVPLLLGEGLRVWAAGYIGRAGRSARVGARELLVSGPYRFSRNPLYLGNLLLVGAVLSALNPMWWLSCLIVVLFLLEYRLIIQAEEHELSQRFGSDYEAYRRSTAWLVGPPGPGTATQRFSFRRAGNEAGTLAVLVSCYLLALLRMRL
jgi:protein-S-isoprenylcysteine O-methyltransferase Ste14